MMNFAAALLQFCWLQNFRLGFSKYRLIFARQLLYGLCKIFLFPFTLLGFVVVAEQVREHIQFYTTIISIDHEAGYWKIVVLLPLNGKMIAIGMVITIDDF